jgi:putative FmdB family regulatory protein
MPIYEYRCEPCDHSFEALIRGGSDVARCPKCGNAEVAKQFSVPAASPTGTLGYSPVGAAPGLGLAPGGFGGGGCGKPGCGPGGCASG